MKSRQPATRKTVPGKRQPRPPRRLFTVRPALDSWRRAQALRRLDRVMSAEQAAQVRRASAVLILAPVERARRPADDPVPVSGYPEFQLGSALLDELARVRLLTGGLLQCP